MNKIIKRVVEFYNSLTTKNRLILLFIIVLIAGLIYSGIINNSSRNGETNYGKLTKEEILSQSYEVKDRAIIMEIDFILNKIADIKYGRYYYKNNIIELNDLYSACADNTLKKSVSKRKFNSKISSFYENVLSEQSSNEINNFINKVYYSSLYNIYMVELKNNPDEYIGFTLYMSDKSFFITYI